MSSLHARSPSSSGTEYSLKKKKNVSRDSIHSRRFSHDVYTGSDDDDGSDERRKYIDDDDISSQSSSDGAGRHTRRSRSRAPFQRLCLTNSAHGSLVRKVRHRPYRWKMGNSLTLVAVLVVGFILVSPYAARVMPRQGSADIYSYRHDAPRHSLREREHELRELMDADADADMRVDFDTTDDASSLRAPRPKRRQSSRAMNTGEDGDNRRLSRRAMLLDNDAKLDSMSSRSSRQAQAHAFFVAPDQDLRANERDGYDQQQQHKRRIIRDESDRAYSVRESDFERLEKMGLDSQSHRRRSAAEHREKTSRGDAQTANEVLYKLGGGNDRRSSEEVERDSGGDKSSERASQVDSKNSTTNSQSESKANVAASQSQAKKKEEAENKLKNSHTVTVQKASGESSSKAAAAKSKESSATDQKTEKSSDGANKDTSSSASKQTKSSPNESGNNSQQLRSADNKAKDGEAASSSSNGAKSTNDRSEKKDDSSKTTGATQKKEEEEEATTTGSRDRIKKLLANAKTGDDDNERIAVNQYFDAVFVINLKRRPQRWLRTKARLARHGIHAEAIEGVDGYLPHHTVDFNAWIDSTPQTEDEIKKGMRAYRSPGSWAIQFTCERAIKTAMERGYSNFLLLDDDVIIHKDFENEFHEKIQLIDPDWKVLFLGGSQWSWNKGAALFKNDNDPFYTPFRTMGTFAVAFDQSTYQTMIDGIALREGAFDAFPMQRAILANINDSYCLYPNLIIADVTASDTQSAKDQYNHSVKMRWQMETMDMVPVPASSLDWPLVSVVTTVRNAASTIELALLSLLEQTYSNIECIVVDDKSSDNTVSIVKKLQQIDDRIVLIENKENIGTYPSRNVALEHARGEVIVIHDGDDVAVPDRIERQAEPIIYGHALLTWGYCIRTHLHASNFTAFFAQDELDWRHMDKQVQSARTHVQDNKHQAYCCREIIGLMTTAYHRSVFDKIGVFDRTRHGGDAEFVERFLAHYVGELIEPSDVINSYLLRNSVLGNNALRIENPPLLWSIEKSKSDVPNLSMQIPIGGTERKAYREQYTKKLQEMIKHREADK